jgi:hypothetical protein
MSSPLVFVENLYILAVGAHPLSSGLSRASQRGCPLQSPLKVSLDFAPHRRAVYARGVSGLDELYLTYGERVVATR